MPRKQTSYPSMFRVSDPYQTIYINGLDSAMEALNDLYGIPMEKLADDPQRVTPSDFGFTWNSKLLNYAYDSNDNMALFEFANGRSVLAIKSTGNATYQVADGRDLNLEVVSGSPMLAILDERCTISMVALATEPERLIGHGKTDFGYSRDDLPDVNVTVAQVRSEEREAEIIFSDNTRLTAEPADLGALQC